LGAGEATAAREDDWWWASEEALRLRSGSAPGRRRVRVRAVSSKSSPEAPEDFVELRSVSTDMSAGDAPVSLCFSARGVFLCCCCG
jgi:hypothetical protein